MDEVLLRKACSSLSFLSASSAPVDASPFPVQITDPDHPDLRAALNALKHETTYVSERSRISTTQRWQRTFAGEYYDNAESLFGEDAVDELKRIVPAGTAKQQAVIHKQLDLVCRRIVASTKGAEWPQVPNRPGDHPYPSVASYLGAGVRYSSPALVFRLPN